MSDGDKTKVEIAKAILAELKKLDESATWRIDEKAYHPIESLQCLGARIEVTIEERWSAGASYRMKPTGKFQVTVARFTSDRKLFPPRKAGIPYGEIASAIVSAAKGANQREQERIENVRFRDAFDATVGGRLRKWIIPKQANRITEAFSSLSKEASDEILTMIERFK